MIRIDLPIRTVSEANARGHWSKKAKRAKGQRHIAWAHVFSFGTAKRRECLPGVVTLTRIAPRALDGDNLQSALKAVRDGVADALGVNDADPRVTWQYAQERGKARQYGVRVEIGARG